MIRDSPLLRDSDANGLGGADARNRHLDEEMGRGDGAVGVAPNPILEAGGEEGGARRPGRVPFGDIDEGGVPAMPRCNWVEM